MDRNKLIGILNESVKSGMTALDSRHTAIFNGMLDRGVEDKLISAQERANYSGQLNKFREKLYRDPLKDKNGQVMTKNVPGFDGKTRVRNMTVRDLLEYDKDEQGNIIPGKYRVPENALTPIYEGGQIGKVAPQNVGQTLGKQGNLAKQFATQQQQATELERRSGESALTPGAYGAIAAGGLSGIVGGLTSDVQAIARIRAGEDRNKVFQDLYGEQTASPTEDAFGFGAQSTRFVGQTAMRGALPAVTGMLGAGIAGAAGTAAGLNPVTGLIAGFGGSIAGAAAGQKAQEALFNALAGDTGKQLTDPVTGKPMVDPLTGKPVYENSFASTGAMQAKMGEGNVVGNIAGNLLPNLVAGSAALPAILDFKKISQVARLGMAARSGQPAAIAALGKMGISQDAAEAAIALANTPRVNTGVAAKMTGALAASRPVTAGKTAMQWLGEASGVTKTLSPIQQQMKNAATAIKAHPELGQFLNELGESAAETGTEIQQAYQNHQTIKEENALRRAKGLEEQAEPSIIEDLVNVLGGVSFEGQHRLGTLGYSAGAALVNKPLSAMGFDIDPRTRAIAEAIKSKAPDATIDAATGRTKISEKQRIIGLGNGEFAVFDPETKAVRLTNAAGIDPRAFGLRTGETAPTGQGGRMADAADLLLPGAGFGKVREFKPVGDSKEIVLGTTHDGMVVRRQVGPDNKIDVRTVSVDQLHPDNQTIAMSFFEKAGMTPSTETGYVEENPYTDIHEEGNIQRQMSGKDYKAFKEAFPAVVALDQNLSVHGRVIRMVGKTHAVVQIPSIGNGTDIVVVPTVNLMSKGDSIRQREAIDDNETNIIQAQSELPQDPKSYNPASTDTDRVTSATLDGGRNPIMLTPEQKASVGAQRTTISSKFDADVASGMAEGVASNAKGKAITAAQKQVINGVAKDSGSYPPGSYIEHTDAGGNTVGAIVVRNTPHGPLVRPLDNGLPYVAQHTTITSGEPTRPTTEATAPTAETAATAPTAESTGGVDGEPEEEAGTVVEGERIRTSPTEAVLDTTPVPTTAEEVRSTPTPTDEGAASGAVGRVAIEGTFEVKEVEDKAIAVITTTLEGKTINDLIAQKPRTKAELVDALTDFLIGTPYKGGKMSAEDARKAASALSNLYDRMIYAQANRLLQMAQDRMAGFTTTRVGSPSDGVGRRRKENKEANEYREHREGDLPLIDSTIGWLDDAAKSLSGETLTWSQLNAKTDAASKALAVEAVEVARRKLMSDYYDTSVPAIGKFEGIKEINDVATGLYAAVENADGQVAGRMLIGFARRDFSTAVHEIAHALFESMPEDMKVDVLKHLGHTPRKATATHQSIIPYEAHEKFATAFETTILNAEHPTEGIKLTSRRGVPSAKLNGVFTDLAPFMRDVYGVIYGETGPTAQSLTWQMQYKGMEDYIFLWDNMPLIVNINGEGVRCKIPLVPRSEGTFKKGPGILPKGDPTEFEVEIVHFGHPDAGKKIIITNADIAAIGGLTNGFNKRMASTLAYWMGNRINQAGGKRRYTGITDYAETSPARISGAKARGRRITVTPAAAVEGPTVEPTGPVTVDTTATPEPGAGPAITAEGRAIPPAPEVVLPAPQMADKGTFVSRVIGDIKSLPGTEKLDPEQLKVAMEALYDANRQNSSIARDKWKNYEFYTQRNQNGAKHIGIKDKATGMKYLVNMVTGDVRQQAEGASSWEPTSPEKAFARQGASAMPYTTLQAGIDAMWQVANAPADLKPKVKGFLHYIAQLHGQAKAIDGVTADWLPMPRTDAMPKNAAELATVTEGETTVDGNKVAFETINTGRNDVKAIDYDGRKIVVVSINGIKVPFYVSTGKAGKVKVQPGRWYPIFGIGSDGWINKGTSDEIVAHYGSPTLKAVAEHLDNTLGDLRGVNLPEFKDIFDDSPLYKSINEGMISSTHSDSGEQPYADAIKDFVDRVEKSKEAAIAKVEEIKKKQKKQPSPLKKTVSADAAVLNAVGMKDLTQDDLDAIGRELLPEQYEALQDPNVQPVAKDALLRLGYAQRIAGVILTASTDKEIAKQVRGSRNALRAKLEVVNEVKRVIDFSRGQVELAEATGADGNVKALSEYEKLTEPTDDNPVISLRQKATDLVFNVNLKTGQTTVTLPDGTTNTSAGLEFLEPKDGVVLSPIWDARQPEGRQQYLGSSITALVGQTGRNKRMAEKNAINPEKMPQIYSGMLHIARMFAAVPIDGKMTAPATPSNVLWKVNNTKAFNEMRSRPLYQLRQADRNKAVGKPIETVSVTNINEPTVKAIMAQEHDNHSMKLIDRSEIMRVKAKDEPTSAQELRASIIDQKVKEIMNSRGEILAKLREEIKKTGGGEIPEGAEPFVYRVIEPSEYIDEETGQFALKYEMDGDTPVLNDAGERIPVLDKDGEPVKDTRLVEKYVMSYSKQPAPAANKAILDMSSLDVYHEDGTRITATNPFNKMERAVKSGQRYVFYDAILPSKDGNGSSKEAQDKALNFIVQSYKTLAARMLQKYTPIVQWEGNDIAGAQVWARSVPELVIKTPKMNGVSVANVLIGSAKTPYNIDAIGGTNRWQSTKITQFESPLGTPASDTDLRDAVIAGNQHYYSVHRINGKFTYKITATNIQTKEIGVFTADKMYASEALAKKAAQEEYKLLRGQAYDIWHKIGAEKIANDVVRLAELSRKNFGDAKSEEERMEIFNARVIMRQYDWYRGVSKKIMQRYGAAGLAMADLVGGTSPQTPVDANWTNAVQALQMMNRTATYERVVREFSGDKHYYKVPFNTERSVQVFAIWRALQAKAVYWRGANTDGTTASDSRRAAQRAARKKDYAQYVSGNNVNETAIRAESDDILREFLGDDIVSKLETKIPDNLKRKMLEDVAISLVQSTLWTKNKGGQDPAASFTGWAQKTNDWLPTDYTQVTPTSEGPVEKKFTNQTKPMDFTVLPRNIFSGSKFGANTDNVLQGMFNTWLDISEEGQAPKARNFSLNLVGLSSGATIDVWAARYVRRMYHEWHQTTPDFKNLPDADKTFFARVPPAAEQGVEGGYLGKSHYSVKYGVDGTAEIVPAKYQRPNPAEPTTGGEFGTGQAVMGLATEYINKATGGKLEMLPSDLQAIVWFAEKQLWMNNGWTNASGAGGSFEYQFAQDVLRYGDLDRFNVMMSGNGVAHLSPEQKERLMQIMRRTLWTEGPTTEGSPVAHMSALVSNSSGDQLDVAGQTQVDINLVAKRGSTPMKPYDPDNDIQAVVLNMSPEGIKEILNGRIALTLPSNILNEHSGRRISLAYRDGKKVNIVGTAVFDGGQPIGSGAYSYAQVPSNELTDSRPVILKIPAEIKNVPESIDSNQLVHIKPNMWVKQMKTYVNSATENGIYPARTDAGKHRRIREHVAYNVNLLKNAAADMLRITGANDAVISRVVGEADGSDDIDYNPESNVRIGHEVYFKPALADQRIDDVAKRAYNEAFSNMIRRMENFFREKNSHVQFVVQQDPRNQYSKASLVNGNVGILAVWSPETELRYLDFGVGVPTNMLTQQQKDNLAKLNDYMSGDIERIRKHESDWNNLFTEFWKGESSRPDGETIPIFQNFANNYDVNAIHKEALLNETAPKTGIDDQSIAWGLGIREKLEHSVQQLGIGIGDGRVILEADTRVGDFNEVLAGDVEKKLQSSAPVRVALYQKKRTPAQQEFHVHAASYAGSRMPGLAGVYDYAMDALLRGNQADYEKSMARLSDRAGQELERVFGGLEGVQVQADRNTGIFFGDVEPSVDATVKLDADKYSIDYVLARAAHLGLMFRQQNVYVTQDAAKFEVPGDISENGYTTEYRATYQLSEPITFAQMKEIQKALDLGGANLSQDGKTLTTFTVTTENETHEQTTNQWYEGISQLGEVLQAQGISAKVKQDVCRLWNTGSGQDGAYGRFTPYGEILDNLRRNNPSALVPFVDTTKYNRNVEEVKADVEFALSMLRGRDIKLPQQISFKRTPVSVEAQMAIADNYDRMPYNAVVPGPYQDPMVVKAYKALVKELDKQWKWLNVKIDFMPRNVLPNGDVEFIDSYNASSAAVIEDIRNNNHLYIYPTTPDTFGEKGMDFTGHPMLDVSPHKTSSGEPLLWNDVLRAVHDALAHSIYGASFGANGEEIAFATHALLTEDPMAIWALNSETRAQNSWVNFNSGMRNPDGSMKSDLPDLSERGFAAQKAALMPIQSLYTGIQAVDDRIDALRKEMETKHDGYNGSIPATDVVDGPMTDGFRVKGTALFQRKSPPKDGLTKKGMYVAGDVDVLASDGVRIDPDLLAETVKVMYDTTDAKAQVRRLAAAYLGHIQRGDIKNPAPAKGIKGYYLLLNGVGLQLKKALKDGTKFGTEDIDDLVDRDWMNATSRDEGVDVFEVINDWYNLKGNEQGNLRLNPVTNEYVNNHGQPANRARLEGRFERDSHGRILMYHATLHGAKIGDEGKLVAGDDVSWATNGDVAGLGGTTNRISLTYNKLYALDVIKMLTNYISIMQSSDPQKVLNKALTNRVDEALLDNEPGAINDRIRYKFTQLAWQLSHPEDAGAGEVIPTYDEAYDQLMDLYKVSGNVEQFVRNLADMTFKNQYGSVTRHFPSAERAMTQRKLMGNKTISSSSMSGAYHDYIESLNFTLGIPYTLILRSSLDNIMGMKVRGETIKPVIYQYAVDPNMLAEHVPSEEELRTFTTGIMEHTGEILDAEGDAIDSAEDGFVPSRPVFAWSLPRKGSVPVPPPAPPAAPPLTTWERIVNGYDNFNDFCRLSVGGDASPILIQNFLLANPIEDPKLFFNQFLIMTKAARPNLSLSWRGKTIINGKNYGRQADVDLGNELRANPWYASAEAHGLTLSSFGKDEALRELQKTNPSATMMDINELGYNQDVAVSNELLQHMPGQGMSERFFSMSKDYVKMNKYAQAVQHLVDIGYVPGTEGFESSARDIAAIINVASGDMKFASQEDADNAFGRVAKRLFFAPRWATSRFALDPFGRAILQATPWGRDVLKRNRIADLQDRDPYAKAMHLRIMAKTFGMWSAFAILYGLLYKNSAIGTSIGKGGMTVQIGDYKFKPPAGIDKTVAMVTSALSIFEANDKLSREEKIGRVADNLKTMMLGQSAPAVSALIETVTGRNLFGEPSREVYTPLQRHWEGVTRPILAKAGVDVPLPKISNMMADKFIYLWAQDMMESYEAMKDRDEPYAGLQSAMVGASAFIGGRARYAPKDLNWKYDAGKNRPAPGIENTFIGAEAWGTGDMEWDKLTR